MSTPHHKFLPLPFCYYQRYRIQNYDFSVVPNGTTSKTNFIQIPPVVLELNHLERKMDRYTLPALYAFLSCISCKDRKVRKATRYLWRRYCLVIKDVPCSARLLRIMAKQMNTRSLVNIADECYIWTGTEALQELCSVHHLIQD